MKSCKIFKLLHLKFDVSEVKELTIFRRRFLCIDIESSCIEYGEPDFQIETPFSYALNIQVKTLKVLNYLEMCQIHQINFNTLIPKLDLSELRQLSVSLEFQLKPDLMAMIFPHSLERLDFMSEPQLHVNPAVLAFERCLNIRDISMSYLTKKVLVSRKEFKKIVRIKRNAKLNFGLLTTLTNIDPEDIVKLVDDHVVKDGKFAFYFMGENSQNYLESKNYIEIIAEQRKQKGIIPKSLVALLCGKNARYHQSL
uniref:Uncharacterized protein n=1 Tax=Panagrolaimus sp. ES5 TaxID=591445 RepID=A0AC34FZD7_9BILA